MVKIRSKQHIIPIILIFILAITLRIKTYLLARPLWHDECSLAVNIISRNIWGYFHALDHAQKAPAFFMMLTKFITDIFGINGLSLRFVPLLCGVISILIFYLLSKKILKNNFTIIVANFLFAINYELIYYSQEFKQYSVDVLLVMICLLLLGKLELSQLDYKECLIYSLLSLLMILASFPCAFVIGAYIVINFFKKQNIKKTLLYCMPVIIFSVLYYFFFLHNVQTKEVLTYSNYWDSGFLKLNLSSVFICFKENLNFFFAPNNYVLIGLILFITGFVSAIKTKNKISHIILLTLFFVVLASIFKIYPIWQRVSLYLLPITLLFIAKTLDFVSKDPKIVSLLTIVLFIFYFSKYDFSYINNFFKPDIFMRNDALTTFPKLIERYNNKDILVINSSTKADCIYYSYIYGFKPKNYFLAVIKQYDKQYYYNILNSLPKGYNYWFIFGWENSISKHLDDYIKEFNLKMLETYENKGSRIVKVRI